MYNDIQFSETLTRYIEETDEDIEIEVEGTYHLGSEGKYHGPWENSYPSEGAEVSISRAYTGSPRYSVELSSDEEDELLEILGRAYGRTTQDAREYAKEAAAEARYDAEKNGDFDDRDEVFWDSYE